MTTFKIDLAEIASRESERVEWKKNVADEWEVVSTLSAFANDFSNLGGGYVVCGAAEGKDENGFQKVDIEGLTASRLKEVEGRVNSLCKSSVTPPIVPIVDELATADPQKRVLIFIMPASNTIHAVRRAEHDSEKYFVRSGRNTIEARNGLLRELLIKKNAMEPWDRRYQKNVTLADIDFILFRDYLQQMSLWDSDKPVEYWISDREQLSTFVPPLGVKEPLTDVLRPCNFTLLMFGKDITRFFPGAYSVFSIYNGKDRSEPEAEKRPIIGSIVEQARKLLEYLDTESSFLFDKDDPKPNQIKYPKKALQESIINAIVHRDYESNQPIRVTVFTDRIEIHSPGSLPRAIDKDTFLKGRSSPYWRNQSLAYFFTKLQLAQNEGQGIPTILRTMHDEGCPDPVFNLDTESVTCILPAHPRHASFQLMRKIESKIILGNSFEALNDVREILKTDPHNFRAIELFCEASNLLKTPGNVYDLLKHTQLDFTKLNSSTLITIAESLLQCDQNPDIVEISNKLISAVNTRRLEESEIKHVAVNFRKLGNNEKAIEFINDQFRRNSSFEQSSSLREILAKSKIDLAKKCMNTARDIRTSPDLKGKAWQECRNYLTDAEKDLSVALQNVRNQTEQEFIMNDIEFLNNMKEIAKKPQRRGLPRSNYHPQHRKPPYK